MKHIITYSIKQQETKVIEAKGEPQAVAMLKETLKKEGKQLYKIDKIETKFNVILNTFNGHNEKLVEYINIIWNDAENHKRIKEILKVLINRDKDEFEDKMFEGCDEKDCFDLLEWLERDFTSCFYEYLHRVADDMDLRIIIDYVRYRNIKGHWLFSSGWVK